ncbi:MAG: hypothetical protein D4Q79_01320 [Spirochaetia bacterium]|nr:MAG: hypothetical protein D4Q79_01320 [Spirochaetia bacterium]
MKGIYWFLWQCPMWAIALTLVFLVIGILFIIRDWREGLPYNVSVASQQGGLALIGVILIGVEIIKRQQSSPLWMGSLDFQLILLTISVIFGIVYQWIVVAKSNEWGTAADAYHNLFVAPLLLFMLGATVPVILLGTRLEWNFSIFFLTIWFATLVYDWFHGRLQQTRWLAAHGIYLFLCRRERRRERRRRRRSVGFFDGGFFDIPY